MQSHNPILDIQLKELKLATFIQENKDIQDKANKEGWSYSKFLSYLCQVEIDNRHSSRMNRMLKESKLPKAKTLSSFNFNEALYVDSRQINALADTDLWVKNANNLIIFGASGLGKTHIASAIAYKKIENGYRVKFFQTFHLVQHLQLAKMQYRLKDEIMKLDKIPIIILDDIGYVRKDEHESSVLFELIAHRYESRSIIITANQPFSKWDEIFPDNMMAVAAIDRLLHHSQVINLEGDSYRTRK